jgi:hypothetical protein
VYNERYEVALLESFAMRYTSASSDVPQRH